MVKEQVIPSPEEHLGFRVGTDKKLADWPDIVSYFEGVGKSSERVKVETLGETTKGEPFILATISSPDNLANLESLREIQLKLQNPEGLGEDEAEELIQKGKTVVMISGSIHSTEVGGSQMSMELLHQMATSEEEEVIEILENVIFLLVPSLNPDGNRIVYDWYNEHLGTEYEGTRPPYLYHVYAGHDNNRDWFMFTLKETQLAIEGVHNQWHPQIVYDIHQMGSTGPRFYVPPFTDPIEPNIDPVIVSGINFMGTSMADELTREGKRGVAVHWVFDAWTPARAYQHYHGGIRILSEAASVDIASPIELKPEELEGRRGFKPLEARWNHPMPWRGGRWTLRDIIDYELTTSLACLKTAAKHRERWLRGSLEIGRRALESEGKPYAFVIPPDQKDPGMVKELIWVLREGDVEVYRAEKSFSSGGVEYPEGSYVVPLAQPYGCFAKTMLERQLYPDLRENPEDEPEVPYDVTAHTLGLQMGVEVHQVDEAFDAEMEKIDHVKLPMGEIHGLGSPYYIFSCETNSSHKAVNMLLEEDLEIYRTCDWEYVQDIEFMPGAFIVGGKPGKEKLEGLLQQGINCYGIEEIPETSYQVYKPRVGIYKAWLPNADEGWLRMVLEDYNFSYEVMTPQDVKQGDLEERFDVIIIPDLSRDIIVEGMNAQEWMEAERYEPKYREGLGEKGTYELQKFLKAGGTVIALNRASSYPVKDLWAEAELPLEDLKEKEFYIPGSVLQVLVDYTHPVGYGLDRETPIMFLHSPGFKVKRGFEVANYPEASPLLSGWILGEEHLHGLSAIADIPVSEGRCILIAFPPHFRNQTRGTFKVLFNSIFYGSSS
ncbi:MAG: M14 family metallopeptidase [Candidatus Bathyarchaeia archaeon]